MPVFAYKALDLRQGSVSGTIAADSPLEARGMLRARGWTVEAIGPQARQRRWTVGWLLQTRGNAARVSSALFELSTLLSVGVDLVEALDTLARQERGYLQTSIMLLKDRIAGGAGLADAMSEQPGVFDEPVVRMVAVGEKAGNLDEVLGQLAEFQERSLQLKDRVLGAVLYPAVVFSTALAVSLFLMTVVVPMLLTNLIEAGRTLPWPTRVLKGTSDFLVAHGLLLAAGALGAVVVTAILIKTKRGRLAWHRLLLRIPITGSLASRQAISRLASTIAVLMRSGIEYIEAADVAAGAATNLVFREALLKSNHEVSTGKDIGVALEETGVFPPLVVQAFSIGQTSGQLENMLDRLAVNYDRQVAALANRLASVLEPILILVLAVFVGFILFATLLPILEAGNVL